MRRVMSSWSIIESELKQHAKSSFKALRRPATEQSLVRLQKHFQKSLPRDFLTSLKIHDGMRLESALLNFMTLLPVADIIKWSQVQRDVQAMAEFPGETERPNPAVRNEWRWRDNWVPMMCNAGGDLLVMDLEPTKRGKRGQLFRWLNSAPRIEVVADSFAAWLDEIAEELLGGRFSVDEFGEIQLKKKLA